jgi:hypothetical protein
MDFPREARWEGSGPRAAPRRSLIVPCLTEYHSLRELRLAEEAGWCLGSLVAASIGDTRRRLLEHAPAHGNSVWDGCHERFLSLTENPALQRPEQESLQVIDGTRNTLVSNMKEQ